MASKMGVFHVHSFKSLLYLAPLSPSIGKLVDEIILRKLMVIEILLTLICILITATLLFVIIFRPRGNENLLLLKEKIDNLQSILHEDLRQNREENTVVSKDNRIELNTAIRDFRSEISETFKTLIDNNGKNSLLITKTLDDKIATLTARVEEQSKTNREALTSNLKDFTLEQRIKFDELKQEQRELINKTTAELEKITDKVEQKLTLLSGQAKDDNSQIREIITASLKDLNDGFAKNIDAFNSLQKEKFAQLEERQNKLVESTEKKLEEMRATVDEKLQKTLNERLGQSFELVGKQLENVQKGLGEMQTLAQDVGGLKKVLSNVKMRGGFGEVQLSLLLENILAPDQYEANVRTKVGSMETVEFAIKLPGKDDNKSITWIPIDAKFPKDTYEQLQIAYDAGDPAQIEIAQRNLENTIKKMAKDIRDKYIDPPNTTDFALLFLPFEGIYAEVVRKGSFLESIQREYKVTPTGPTTLAAILNSLQMGFRSLAIQRRSSEVWQTLGAVKKEFENFGTLLQKAQNNLQTASNQIDEVMGKRTRAIQRSLKNVETLSDADTNALLPSITEGETSEEEIES
jgi:DNA recombination protein RmuC